MQAMTNSQHPSLIKRIVRETWTHVQFSLKPPPVPQTDVDVRAFEGEFSEEQHQFAKEMYERSLNRIASVESKANSALNLLTFLVPLIIPLISVALSFPGGGNRIPAWVVIASAIAALIFAGLAAFKAFRVTGIKGTHTLHLSALVNEDQEVRNHSGEHLHDFRARGYLHCALQNDNVADHYATTVKVLQRNTRIAVVLLAIAAAFLLANNLDVGRTQTRSEQSFRSQIVTHQTMLFRITFYN